MTDLPPYTREPIRLPDGTAAVGWHGPVGPIPVLHRRCSCGRPVPPSSLDGVNCAEHDQELSA